MSLLSCLFLVMTLMACSAASPEKKIQVAKMMGSTDESMAKESLFGRGSLLQHKIKKMKKLITPIIGKKKGIRSKGLLFGIGSLIKQKMQNKKKLIQQKYRIKRKASKIEEPSWTLLNFLWKMVSECC